MRDEKILRVAREAQAGKPRRLAVVQQAPVTPQQRGIVDRLRPAEQQMRLAGVRALGAPRQGGVLSASARTLQITWTLGSAVSAKWSHWIRTTCSPDPTSRCHTGRGSQL